jgi:hypothetical protein
VEQDRVYVNYTRKIHMRFEVFVSCLINKHFNPDILNRNNSRKEIIRMLLVLASNHSELNYEND